MPPEQRQSSPRSAFVPLLALSVLLALAGLIGVLVPLRKCAVCAGGGTVTYIDGNPFPFGWLTEPYCVTGEGSTTADCATCLREGEVSLLKRWFSPRLDLSAFSSSIVDCYVCRGTGKDPNLGTTGGCPSCLGKGKLVEFRPKEIKPNPR